ncbi:MAG: hypothetical protein QG671_3506 [Actinomycetota bacterium]|nr:hypothetical protein [Actinomycetota bacterium]
MPGGNRYPLNGIPLSRAELRKVVGKGHVYEFLNHFARDTVRFWDDFLVDTLNTDFYAAAAGGDATTWAHLAGTVNGVVKGITGDTGATSGLQLYTPAFYKGDYNIGCIVRFQVSSIASLRLEIGFADVLPSVNTTVVNSLSTPTFGSGPGDPGDAAVYVYDKTSTTVTTGLYTLGSGGIGAAKKAVTATTSPLYGEPAANTYQTWRVEVVGNLATAWVDGILVAQNTASAVEGGTAMSFVISAKANADSSSHNILLDYVEVWHDRA